MKPIQVTDDFKTQAFEAFKKALDDYKITDGALSFKMEPATVDSKSVAKPVIKMHAAAYLKMMGLVLEHPEECCWHGTVNRISTTEFEITDVLCYPQFTAAATVEADDAEYVKWNMQLEDDVVNSLHFQGHSHVNMGVTPSGTDTNNWNDWLGSISADSYFIFCIANKKSEINWWIFDLATNWIYEPKDITCVVTLPDGQALKTWASESLKTYAKKKPISTLYSAAHRVTAYGSGTPTHRSSYYADDYDAYGYQNSLYGNNTGAWDELLDDDEIETSKTWRTGYRWSNLRQLYVRLVDKRDIPFTPQDAKPSKKSYKTTKTTKSSKKPGGKK